MKKHLGLILLYLLGMMHFGASGQSVTSGESNARFSISGKSIWAIYSHGGPLAEVRKAEFTVSNPTKEGILLKIEGLHFIAGNLDSAMHLTVDRTKAMKNVIVEISNGKETFHGNEVLILPQTNSTLILSFEPISVEASYHQNYQALRLDLRVEDKQIQCDAEIDAEREEDDDFDK